MNKLPTAEEFFNKRSKELGFENWTNVIVQQEWDIIEKLPIEFTKLHIQEALKEAHAQAIHTMGTNSKEFKDSILNAYPLTNIK